MKQRWRWGGWVLGACALTALAVRWWPGSTRDGFALPPALPPGMHAVTLNAAGAPPGSAWPVRVAYRDYRGSAQSGAIPIVLLHGSPGSAEDFGQLAEQLATSRQVIAPDLPGFGHSTRTLPDYSFRSHAHYVCSLLAEIGIPRAHILGFSMGGGVALSLFALCPERLKSLVLLSAIGVQEMELLGDYHLNHAVHGAQLAALWLLAGASPNRGALDGALSYARNFYDSDQRPLRGVLMAVDVPVLIVHGKEDPLVPLEAAREHARLVPQSELRELPGTHFMLFEDSGRLAPIVAAFLSRVDDARAIRRAQADAGRLVAAARLFDPRIVPRAQAVTALVLGVLAALTTLLAGKLGPIAAGVLVSQGRLGPIVALTACAAGTVVHGWRRTSSRPVPGSLVMASMRFAVGVAGGAVLLRTPLLSTADAWTRALTVTLIVAVLSAAGTLVTPRSGAWRSR